MCFDHELCLVDAIQLTMEGIDGVLLEPPTRHRLLTQFQRRMFKVATEGTCGPKLWTAVELNTIFTGVLVRGTQGPVHMGQKFGYLI